MSRVCGGKVPKLNLAFYCCDDDSVIAVAPPRASGEPERDEPATDHFKRY